MRNSKKIILLIAAVFIVGVACVVLYHYKNKKQTNFTWSPVEDRQTRLAKIRQDDFAFLEGHINSNWTEMTNIFNNKTEMYDISIIDCYFYLLPSFSEKFHQRKSGNKNSNSNIQSVDIYTGINTILLTHKSTGKLPTSLISAFFDRISVTQPTLLLLPIRMPQKEHFTLVAIDFTTLTIESYDSCNGNNKDTLDKIKTVLKSMPLLKDLNFMTTQIKVPSQGNGYDCGPATCLNARLRVSTNDFNYQTQMYQSERKKMVDIMVNREIPLP